MQHKAAEFLAVERLVGTQALDMLALVLHIQAQVLGTQALVQCKLALDRQADKLALADM